MSTFTTLIRNPHSFHPVSESSFHLSRAETDLLARNCSLYLFYRLPPALLIDPYELAQRQQSYTFVKWGQADLEKPVHAVHNSNTDILISVNVPSPSPEGRNDGMQLDVEVPLHARYGVPLPTSSPKVGSASYQTITLEPPKAFIACSNEPVLLEHESPTPPTYLSESQLHELNLTPERTYFTHIHHSLSDHPFDVIRIPIGHKKDLVLVQSGTATVVLLSFLWIAIVAIRTATRLHSRCPAVERKVD